jgi:DNA-binding LytR/AlgR family response regulator
MSDVPTESLSGVTAIIVEDNMLVADSTRILLEALDAVVAGMAGTVERGLALVRDLQFDVAILDIDLRGRSVVPVVRAVEAAGKPFVFISGYGDAEILPDDYRSATRLNKPIEPGALVAAVKDAVGASVDSGGTP